MCVGGGERAFWAIVFVHHYSLQLVPVRNYECSQTGRNKTEVGQRRAKNSRANNLIVYSNEGGRGIGTQRDR